MSVEVDGSINDRWSFESNPKLLTEAEELWAKDQSGAFALQQSVMWGGFLKLKGLEDYAEYKSLPKDQQEYLSRPAVPAYEFINNSLLWPPGAQLQEGNSYMTFIAFLMNPQSEGEITLKSKDPKEKPVIKLNYLTHPYDKRIFREAIRTTWTKLTQNPQIAPSIRGNLSAPKSLSDEDVDAFARDNASTVWHANGTAKMGRKEDPGACVDGNGKVYGVKGLRIGDLSIMPLTTNNHTQSTAYLVGQKIAEKVIREYSLDKGHGATKL